MCFERALEHDQSIQENGSLAIHDINTGGVYSIFMPYTTHTSFTSCGEGAND